MIQAGEDAGFAFEPKDSLLVLGERGRQGFDRDISPQARVMGSIDLPHAPRADQGANFVRAHACAQQ